MSNKFTISINLNALNHLGINLYSNIPAVLSEVVANSWDADAQNVKINIFEDEIVIEDDGHGMDEEDINGKYLSVGHQKRIKEGPLSPVFNRQVMGRKGIGKLSLFSIATHIEVYSYKDGEKNALLIDADALKQVIDEGTDMYHPSEIDYDEFPLTSNGTKIVLRNLKKRVHQTVHHLRKRLARRFSIIGEQYKFNVLINGEKIRIEDRDYFRKLKDIWCFTDETEHNIDYKSFCDPQKLKNCEQRPTIIPDENYKVYGWIGAVENAGDLKDGEDNLNKIVIVVRGKVAQEDILEQFSEGGLYSKYLMGEIHADFLDLDDQDDIATSSRQQIMVDDPRYIALKNHLFRQLKHIQSRWTDLRQSEAKDVAFKIPAIENWFNNLGKDAKRKADKLFGKINQIPLDNSSKKELFKHSVLAFESLQYKQNLDVLENISVENIGVLSDIIEAFDDIEATLYHQIVNERLQIIELLNRKVDENALEKALQEHLYNHLWLLDASWDRATETPVMESTMKKEFESLNGDLSEEERRARIDIKYKKTSGKHIIIELKRAEVEVNFYTLYEQIDKYHTALTKSLHHVGISNEPIEIICVLGKLPKQWKDPSTIDRYKEQLKPMNARIVLYKELIEDSQRAYGAYLEKYKEAGRVTQLLKEIELAEL